MRKPINAVIFDMDGVISDTQHIHSRIESELLREHGIDLHPDEITKKYAGTTSYHMFPDVFRWFKKEMPPLEEIVTEKRKRIDAAIEGAVEEVPGTREFIERLKKEGIPIAVASASRLSFIRTVLKELKLEDAFDAIASSEEVEKGKPDPDVFLLAASRLGVEPENAVVIEDGINGMIAAKRAKMRCVGLVREGEHDLQTYPVDLLMRSLKDLELKDIP